MAAGRLHQGLDEQLAMEHYVASSGKCAPGQAMEIQDLFYEDDTVRGNRPWQGEA